MTSPTLLIAQADPGQAQEAASELVANWRERLDVLFHPDELLTALTGLPLLIAAIMVPVGLMCVFNGYRWHKWVIALMAFMCGIGMGMRLSQEMGKSTIVAGAVGCLCAIIATPLLRVAVAVFGGLTGAFIGANTWTALEMNPPDANWAGAMMGFVIIAMASLVLFRLVVVLFTSVGGAAMTVLGGIALLMQVPDWEIPVRDSLTGHQMMIPLLLLLAAVSGFVIQESRLRSGGMSIMAREGGGGGGDDD